MTTLIEKGIDTSGKATGTVKLVCPQCSAGRKDKRDTCLTVTFQSQTEAVWHCHHCQWSGNLGQRRLEEKAWVIPPYNNTPLCDQTLGWFENERKISRATLLRLGITEHENKGCRWINFNYRQKGELVNVKYRKSNEKKFFMAKDAKLIFYNLDSLEGAELAFITEGELDTLTLYECLPQHAALSVPNGAATGSRLEYLDNCWSDLERLTTVVLCTDTDAPGLALREELARRLGKERCYTLSYPAGCKDLNDVLMQYGPNRVKEVCCELFPYPLEGITEVYQMEAEIDDLYDNGYPKGADTGFSEFDKRFTAAGGEVTMITGSPQSGKSEFLDELLARYVDRHGWRIGVFSYENQPAKLHFAKIAERFTGRKLYHDNKNFQMSREELYAAKLFAKSFFFVNGINTNITIGGLLEKAENLVKAHGIKVFVIDPWNCVEHARPKGQNETEYVSEQMSVLTSFAKRTGLHIFLVAHPAKLQKDKKTGQFEVPTLYSISGSAHFFNKTDNGFAIFRNRESGLVEVHVQKVRYKWVGKTGGVAFSYDWMNGRYKEEHAL